MDGLAEELEAKITAWDERGWPRPTVMVVSGSGLAVELASGGEPAIDLDELLPFPARHVEGHTHRVELLRAESEAPVLYFQGRLHSYQGYDAHQTVFAVRLGALLGAHTLLMTNAAGGLHREQRPGELALIRDQINLTGLNPLRGELPAGWGPRFPDMAGAHDAGLRALAAEKAAELGIDIGQGVYAGLAGPSYETPAEVAMLRRLGADLVGMSTVLEVIAAHHLGVRCLCWSLISNLGAGVEEQETLTHEDVLAAGRAARGDVRRLLEALLDEPRLLERPAAA